MSLRKIASYNYSNHCPYGAENISNCEYWCGADETYDCEYWKNDEPADIDSDFDFNPYIGSYEAGRGWKSGHPNRTRARNCIFKILDKKEKLYYN